LRRQRCFFFTFTFSISVDKHGDLEKVDTLRGGDHVCSGGGCQKQSHGAGDDGWLGLDMLSMSWFSRGAWWDVDRMEENESGLSLLRVTD
jgi:hypothetical protein